MQQENSGKFIEITKIKVKDEKVLVEYKEDEQNKKVKIMYKTFENHCFKEGTMRLSEFLFILKSDYQNEIRKYIINLMVKKPYSKKDVIDKCNNKFCEYPKDLIIDVIEDLEDEKIIDDKEYVLTYLEYFNNAYYGKYYIMNYFKGKNIKPSILDKLEFSNEDEETKAKKYFELIKNKYVSSNFIKQKKKIYEAMLRRGFDNEIINSTLSSLNIDKDKEKKLLLKDYKKAKEKYQKLEDFERKDKIISSLVNKGYRYGEIIDLIHKEIEGEDLEND